MARDDSYQNQLSPTSQALITALQAGLAGNSLAAGRLARRIARNGLGEKDDAALRRELNRLLTDLAGKEISAGSTRRRAVATALPPLPVDAESRLALAHIDTDPDGIAPVLAVGVLEQLRNVVAERLRQAEFSVAGIEPTKTLLLAGPPGTGKTMSARYLATALSLPLVSVELAALMSSFLGRTGQNLRQLLDFTRERDCVVLLDEFDALAKKRDDVTDVGELKRIVNVLLLELERWPSTSLLIAATNHPHLLDPAIERRFDCVVRLELPDATARLEIIRRQVTDRVDVGGDSDGLLVAAALATDGMSGAHLERVVKQAIRASLIHGTSVADELAAVTLERLREQGEDRSSRALFSHLAHTKFGMSYREIAKLLSVTHPTVGKLIAEAEAAIDERSAA